MKINEIYTKYKIPKILQQHMYRVAAVSSIVCDNLDKSIPLDKDIVIQTALLHDMGNTIKMHFVDNSFVTREEFEDLEKDKEEFVLKYGSEEHDVTRNILKEIGVSPKVIDILDNIGSSKIESTIKSDDWHRKISSYADFRVAPNGIVSVTERFDEIKRRYEGRNHILADIEKTEQKKKQALILEAQIQDKSTEFLNNIDDLRIKDVLEKLKEFDVNLCKK